MKNLKSVFLFFAALAAIVFAFTAAGCVSSGAPAPKKEAQPELFPDFNGVYDNFENGIKSWKAVIGYNGFAAAAAEETATVKEGAKSMKMEYGGKAQYGIAEFSYAPLPEADYWKYKGLQMDVWLPNKDQVELIFRSAGDKEVYNYAVAVDASGAWVTVKFPFDKFDQPGWHSGNKTKNLQDAFTGKTVNLSSMTVLVEIRNGAVNTKFTGYLDNVRLYQ
jgi:hypothetical protein